MRAVEPSGEQDVRTSGLLQDREQVARVLAVVAHELRGPLHAVRGYAAELLGQVERSTAISPSPLATTTGQRPLAETARQVERSLELVILMLDRLRDSWTADGQLHLQLEAAELNELVEETVTDVAMALDTDHPVDVRSPLPGIPIVVDIPRIRQILFNLISNAASYSPPGTPLLVSTKVDGATVSIEVSSDGDGVAAADGDAAFERFSPIDDTAGSGLGIGLWLSREIARAHGGELRTEPGASAGSRFVLELPRRPADHLDDD